MAAPLESPLAELRFEGLRRRPMGARKRREAATAGVNQQLNKPKWIDSTKRLSRPGHNSQGSGLGSGSKNMVRSEETKAHRTPLITSRSAFGSSYVTPIVNPPVIRPRQNYKSVKAKVDSHLCSGMLMSSNLHPSMPNAGKNNKPLTEAHEQLELMLNHIEQTSDPVPQTRRRQLASTKAMRRPLDRRPMPPAPAASPMVSARRGDLDMAPSTSSGARRSLQILDVHTGTFISYEESLRRQQHSAAAAAAAKGSKQPTTTTETSATALPNIPLVHNPQLLPPAKREALLQLLSRAEQHDKGIVEILRSAPGHDPSRETMRMMLQMLPLIPGDSPYNEKFWAGHQYLKERQKLHQELRPDDIRFKEVKIIRGPNGQKYLSRTLEEELKDEKMVLEFMEAEMKRRAEEEKKAKETENDNDNDIVQEPLNEREEQAMRERAELDEEKQRIINLRAKHNRAELKKEQKKATEVPKPEKRPSTSDLATVRPEVVAPSTTEEESSVPTTHSVNDLIKQRDQFQVQCQRSCLYNNPHDPEPWKLYANVAKNISSELMDIIDGEFNRSVANFIKDFVDSETRL